VPPADRIVDFARLRARLVRVTSRRRAVRIGDGLRVECDLSADPAGVRLLPQQAPRIAHRSVLRRRLAAGSPFSPAADPDPRVVPFRGTYLADEARTTGVALLIYPVPEPALPVPRRPPDTAAPAAAFWSADGAPPAATARPLARLAGNWTADAQLLAVRAHREPGARCHPCARSQRRAASFLNRDERMTSRPAFSGVRSQPRPPTARCWTTSPSRRPTPRARRNAPSPAATSSLAIAGTSPTASRRALRARLCRPPHVVLPHVTPPWVRSQARNPGVFVIGRGLSGRADGTGRLLVPLSGTFTRSDAIPAIVPACAADPPMGWRPCRPGLASGEARRGRGCRVGTAAAARPLSDAPSESVDPVLSQAAIAGGAAVRRAPAAVYAFDAAIVFASKPALRHWGIVAIVSPGRVWVPGPTRGVSLTSHLVNPALRKHRS